MMKLHCTGSDAKRRAFTLIELLTVIAIIAILAGLVLGISNYASNKGARARAEGEIHAMVSACENYKVDNAVYPRGPAAATPVGAANIPKDATDALDAKKSGDSSKSGYTNTSLYLYTELSGDTDGDGAVNTGYKSYMRFAPESLAWTDQAKRTPPVKYIMDPFGLSYGYSTANQDYQDEVNGVGKYTTPKPSATMRGYNPTFDLWSTGGKTTAPTPGAAGDVTLQWIKNW